MKVKQKKFYSYHANPPKTTGMISTMPKIFAGISSNPLEYANPPQWRLISGRGIALLLWMVIRKFTNTPKLNRHFPG